MVGDSVWVDCVTEVPPRLLEDVCLYQRFNAAFNEIGEISHELPFRLPHLTHINLGYNRIKTLPVNFALFFHLDTLLMNNNMLKGLPESFCHLANLSKLDLSHNSFTELPSNLGHLPALSYLNVSNNKLKHLPLSLGGCSSLIVILAKGNRLIDPPQSVCNEGSDKTIQYLHQQFRSQSPVQTTCGVVGDNIFQRVRGSWFSQSVTNVHSAHTLYVESQADMYIQNRMKTPLLPPSSATTMDVDELSDCIVGL